MVTVRSKRRVGRAIADLGTAGAYPAAMDTPAFDPTAPLPGAPDPWASTDTPSPREGPPFHMTEMIAAEPSIAGRIVAAGTTPGSAAAVLADEIRRTLEAGRPVVVTGCGTSEHGALAVAEILRETAGGRGAPLVWSAQAFELAQQPPSSGLVIGISHEGATWATNAALAGSRDAGAGTALITVSDRSPGAALADVVVVTHELDQSWCHTVGYLSPIAAATAVAGHLTGSPTAPDVVSEIVAGGLGAEAILCAGAIAGSLAGVERVLVIASGADRTAGRELVLKIEEGAWLPAAYRDLETFLHGHLAATDVTTGLVVIATDRRGREARTARVRGALQAARVVGMPSAAIVSTAADAGLPSDLTPIGRIVVPDPPDDVPAAVAALLGSATALQTLTERLSRARGINPDPIHRDVDRFREAADAADAVH
jgi:fructoselysine-6-P-deglycase FrlB-like protein